MKAINKDILRLAIPSILANITIPLVGIVDTAIVGHLSDASAIGGIAIGTMLFDLLYWNFGFLRVGTSGLTAQAYGKGQSDQGPSTKVPDECRKILTQSVSVALIAAVVIWAIQWVFVTAVLAIVPCSDEVAAVAREYFYVRIWAAPATLCLFTFKGWFIGMQDTKSPMAIDILVNVVNMAASYALAVYTPLGVVGVAWGTLIAQYSGLLLALIILFARYFGKSLFRNFEEWRAAMQWKAIKRMMSLNGNLFIRSLCFMVVYVGYTSLASLYGDTELAVSSIMMKLFMFFSFFVDGFAYAGEALVGKEWGKVPSDQVPSTKDDGVNAVVRALFLWALAVGAVFTAIYGIWGKGSIALLTSDAAVLEASTKYIGWLIAMPIISTLAFMWDGVYVGATAGVQIRNSMIWAAAGFVLGYALTYRFVGAQALYIGYFAHLIARAAYLTIEWRKVKG
ncbi:MAG: MATE family efflux transporter [Paludibacteraceae bacterium]|nr:MATE family efflux transporter [Paludibacteraceae bacterium]